MEHSELKQTTQSKRWFDFEAIGRIHSCFPEKFGIPRQAGLVAEAQGAIELFPPFDQEEALRGLAGFSHIWVLFVFHRCLGRAWKATVRPPRLGGNRRVGVFASRSGFRPNPIGQSAVSLLGVERRDGKAWLRLGGIDLLDGTPVLDIKPYLPYADHIPRARGGYAQEAPPSRRTVVFTPAAASACRTLGQGRHGDLEGLITALLHHDPRPAYRDATRPATFGMALWDLNIRFCISGDRIEVQSVGFGDRNRPASSALQTTPLGED